MCVDSQAVFECTTAPDSAASLCTRCRLRFNITTAFALLLLAHVASFIASIVMIQQQDGYILELDTAGDNLDNIHQVTTHGALRDAFCIAPWSTTMVHARVDSLTVCCSAALLFCV